MLLPCTQERRQIVVAAHQPPGRVPESALSLGLWRLLRRSRAPAGSAPRLEGPSVGAAASAGAGAAAAAQIAQRPHLQFLRQERLHAGNQRHRARSDRSRFGVA